MTGSSTEARDTKILDARQLRQNFIEEFYAELQQAKRAATFLTALKLNTANQRRVSSTDSIEPVVGLLPCIENEQVLTLKQRDSLSVTHGADSEGAVATSLIGLNL